MSTRIAVSTPSASAPLPVFSQAVKSRGMVYVSGNIGLDPASWKLVEGGIKAQTVRDLFLSILFSPSPQRETTAVPGICRTSCPTCTLNHSTEAIIASTLQDNRWRIDTWKQTRALTDKHLIGKDPWQYRRSPRCCRELARPRAEGECLHQNLQWFCGDERSVLGAVRRSKTGASAV